MRNETEPNHGGAAPDAAPIQAPYAHHIFFCGGPYCDPDGKARQLYNNLGSQLGELGQYDNPARVKRGLTPCLGVCYGGPLLVVYPDGIWYHHVDEALLERIIHEHLEEGRPVEEAIFHRLPTVTPAQGGGEKRAWPESGGADNVDKT